MGFEMLPAIKAVVAAINGDDELMADIPSGAHLFLAPQGTGLPYIIVSPTTQVDVYGTDAARLLSMPLLMVRVLVDGLSPAPVENALKRLDDVLSSIRLQVDEFYIHGVTREPSGAIMYAETRDDATLILHIGATYRAHSSQI